MVSVIVVTIVSEKQFVVVASVVPVVVAVVDPVVDVPAV